MFVIPCRFDPERPVIYECVEAIQRHHDNPKILVVDSASADKSYFDWLAERGVQIAPINNQHYGIGAFGWAYRHYSDQDFFYLIYDSLIVQCNLDQFQERQLTTIRHWHHTQHDWGWDQDGVHLAEWGGRQLDRMGVPRTEDYHGIMGPMFFAQASVMAQLDEIGFWFTTPETKYELCAMERVTGIVLEHLGHRVTGSLQGVHTHHGDNYDESFVRKLDMARM